MSRYVQRLNIFLWFSNIHDLNALFLTAFNIENPFG